MKNIYVIFMIAALGAVELSAMKHTPAQFERFDALFSDLTARYLEGSAITPTQLDIILGQSHTEPIDWDQVRSFAIKKKDLILSRAEQVLQQKSPMRADLLNVIAGLKILLISRSARVSDRDLMKTIDLAIKLAERFSSSYPQQQY